MYGVRVEYGCQVWLMYIFDGNRATYKISCHRFTSGLLYNMSMLAFYHTPIASALVAVERLDGAF